MPQKKSFNAKSMIFAVSMTAILCGISVPVSAGSAGDSALQYSGEMLSLDMNDSLAFAGKPVSLLAGVEAFKRTDLTLGKIFPITLVREYHGKSSYDSPLGYGWAFNYDKRLYVYPDGSVVVRQGYGKKQKFEHYNENGTGPLVVILSRPHIDCIGCIAGPPVVDNTVSLTVNADGTYVITGKHGDKEYYDIFGRLVKMEDNNGNSLVFYYEYDVRSAIWGLLPANVDQTAVRIVSKDYRISRIEEKDASGAFTNQWVLFYYDNAMGWLTDIVDGTGRTVSYSHDNIGNLTNVSGPSGNAVYGYTDANGNHRMTSINEGSGLYENEYNSKGIITRQTHGSGIIDIEYVAPYLQTKVTTAIKDGSGNTLNTNSRKVDFDSQGRVAINTDNYGHVTYYQSNIYNDPGFVSYRENTGTYFELRDHTSYAYDDKANMVTKTEAVGLPLERTTSYTYHPQLNLVTSITEESIVNPSQNKVTMFTYDDTNGNLLSSAETGLLGNGTPYTYTATYTHDANGKITSIDGPRSDAQDVIAFDYDLTTGFLRSMTQPVIGTTTFSNHDGLGNPRTATDPNNNVTTYTFDALSRITAVKAPGDTNALQITYATSGCSSCGGGSKARIDLITMPEGNIIDFDYDSFGNLSTIKDSQNNSINYTYDSEGNRLTEQIKDGSGSLQKTLSFTYDELNRLKKVVNPDSFAEYAYDFRGSRKSTKDPKGNTTNYDYDTLKRLTTVTQPDSIATNFGYTTSDNLTTVADANGNTTTYKYDDQGRVYQVLSPDTGTTTYAYDPAGNLTSKTDAKGVTISYTYDALNRLTLIDFPADTDIVYTYDTCPNGKGRLCAMADASGTTSYEYSPKGQVTKETKVISGHTYITQYTYDQNGNVKTMTYPSGKVIDYHYTNDRVDLVKNGAAILATSIQYKPFGGMSAITYGNGLASSIGYDTQYRLSSLATSTFQNLTYGYDYNGNITSIAPSKTYGYDTLDRLGTATGPWGSLEWEYDGVGNRKNHRGDIYDYAPGTNKLTNANGISIGYDNNGNTTIQSSRIYTYNQNQRLIQVVDGAITANYTYNGNGQRVKKTVNGTVTIFHYSLNGQIIAESNSAGTITAEYVYLNNQPMAKMEGVNTYYYHNDHLATPQKMTDASGTVVWSADYKPFGEATITVSTITNNLRFPGQYFDAETGTHYNYFRDYNPAIGRYSEADPIGLRGGLDPYVYVKANPVGRID